MNGSVRARGLERRRMTTPQAPPDRWCTIEQRERPERDPDPEDVGEQVRLEELLVAREVPDGAEPERGDADHERDACARGRARRAAGTKTRSCQCHVRAARPPSIRSSVRSAVSGRRGLVRRLRVVERRALRRRHVVHRRALAVAAARGCRRQSPSDPPRRPAPGSPASRRTRWSSRRRSSRRSGCGARSSWNDGGGLQPRCTIMPLPRPVWPWHGEQ